VPGYRSPFTPVAQAGPEAWVMKKPSLEPPRRARKARGGQDQKGRGRQHGQKGADKADRNEQKAGTEIKDTQVEDSFRPALPERSALCLPVPARRQ
jgi:hypothetical protein